MTGHAASNPRGFSCLSRHFHIPAHSSGPRSSLSAPLRWLGLAVVLLAALAETRAEEFFVPPNQRVQVQWVGPNLGEWKLGSNWSTGLAPQDGQSALVTQDGSTPLTVLYTKSSPFVPTLNSLLVEGTGTGAVTLRQSGPHDDLNAIFAIDEIIGRTGTGILDQQGGVNLLNGNQGFNGGATGHLILGAQATGHGTYLLSGPTGALFANPSASSELVIGDAGTGIFRQTGGAAVTNSVILGKQSGSTGHLALNNSTGLPANGAPTPTGAEIYQSLVNGTDLPATGVLLSREMIVGRSGTGSVVQTGGVNQVETLLSLAGSREAGADLRDQASTGSYRLTGDGRLSAHEVVVGHFGQGTFAQGGGDVTSTLMTVGHAGQGGYLQEGGTNSVDWTLTLGRVAGSSGHYTLDGGTLAAENQFIGFDGSGTFTQNGGTNHGWSVYVGSRQGEAAYAIGGDAQLQAVSLAIGYAGMTESHQSNRGGAGRFDHAGGTVTVGYLDVGRPLDHGGTDTPVYRMTGGTLEFGSASIGNTDHNRIEPQPGVFEQSGGVVRGNGQNTNGFLVWGSASNYALSGGELHTDLLAGIDGAVIRQTGGTVHAGHEIGLSGGSYEMDGTAARIILTPTGDHGRGSGSLGISASYVVETDSLRFGEFRQTAGTVEITSRDLPYVRALRLSGGGSYELGGTGSLVLHGSADIGGFTNIHPGIPASPLVARFDQTGGTNQVDGTLRVAGDTPLIGTYGAAGTYHLAGGTLTAGAVDNRGRFEYSGGTLAAGSLANSGTMVLSGGGTRTVTGNLVNTGTIQVHDTTAVFAGTFTNHGAYLSDPSLNIFSQDLAIGEHGYLSGGRGDRFVVGGSFLNASSENLLWNTLLSDLVITGPGLHDFLLTGVDLGIGSGGYQHNFAWGMFHLDAGASLHLRDGNATPGAALYTGLFGLGGGLSQLALIQSDYNVYYDASLAGNAWLGGRTYEFSGSGRLIGWHGGAQVPDIGPTLLLILLSLAWLVRAPAAPRAALHRHGPD